MIQLIQSRDGWYKPSAIVLIRNLTKLKYAYIHEHNLAPPNEICYRTIEDFERELQQS
jgi:general transcription factor 3C polypeptide 5 (transcription factor C subunit 1)